MHSLDRFNFAVPDAEAARKFYSAFGLDLREEAGALHIHTHGHPHRWGSVIEGPRKQLRFITFGAFEEDLPRFRERLGELRIERIDPPQGVESNGIWLRDPDGTSIEITVAEKTSPDEKSSLDDASAGPGVASAPSRIESKTGTRTSGPPVPVRDERNPATVPMTTRTGRDSSA